MKKKDFDNRLQNDLFPEMPASFERGLQKTMEEAGVQTRKRPSAKGVFAGAVSLMAAAACLLIVLIGVLGGGKSQKNAAASQAPTVRMAQPTPGLEEWRGDTKVITLSDAFDFENTEKYEAVYQGILRFLSFQGESEPDELWLCAIKNRFVKEDTGNRADGYLSGYYVLARHAFRENDDGPELYCLSENFEVLWATEGSVSGPNHAVNPEKDSYAGDYQRHFLYGTEPMIAEPGIPHVKRGAVVGKEKGTDIEFSMAASITEVQSRLSAAGSAYPGAAREFFLVTISASDWEYAMAAHTLRFETEEGPVDVDMETELPEGRVVLGERFIYSPAPTRYPNQTPTAAPDEEPADPVPTKDPNRTPAPTEITGTKILDLTAEWDDKEAVEVYAQAVARAMWVSEERISAEGIWILGVSRDGEDPGETWPKNAWVLAWNVSDGESSPELFCYEAGRIVWRTAGADAERINVVYHNGNTVVFGKSPAFDGEPLPMSYGKIVLKDGGSDQVTPILPLDEIRERITGGPHYYSARECFLWTDGAEHEVSKLTIAARIDGNDREYTLDKVNVLDPRPVPAMAVRSDGVVYPGKVTHLAHALHENGLAADGAPLTETLRVMAFEEIRIVRNRDRALPWEILTASDDVTADRVEVYSENLERLYTNAEIGIIDELPAGRYYLCFRTTIVGPYSEKIGRYTYRTDYTIYKAVLN